MRRQWMRQRGWAGGHDAACCGGGVVVVVGGGKALDLPGTSLFARLTGLVQCGDSLHAGRHDGISTTEGVK
jgi:hypothetical protein